MSYNFPYTRVEFFIDPAPQRIGTGEFDAKLRGAHSVRTESRLWCAQPSRPIIALYCISESS